MLCLALALGFAAALPAASGWSRKAVYAVAFAWLSQAAIWQAIVIYGWFT